jgi:histidyl-tRNA synthetase
MIVLGEDELKNGVVTFKDIEENKEDVIQILLKN